MGVNIPMKRNLYPKNWKTISHQVRFERAGGKCEWCGVEHDRWVWYHPELVHVKSQDVEDGIRWYGISEGNTHQNPEHGYLVVLTTAHIHDPNPQNCELDNLAALCQTCHNRHDAKMRHRNRALREQQEQEKAGQLRLFKDGSAHE